MGIDKYWKRRVTYWKRDQIILNDLKRPTKKNQVNLHWYSCNRSDGKENFGDYLSVEVFRYMLRKFGLDEHQNVDKTKHLYGIGSILFWGRQDAVIWGSGLLSYPPGGGTFRSKKFHLDIRAVRGPETRKILLKEGFDCPEVYGDPAIFMPLIYQPEDTKKEYEYSVILHKSDQRKMKNQISILCKDYREVIDKIVKSKLVISSSLHGIIVAEAYGVPAVMLSDTRADFNDLKYNDYYFSTGRYQYPVVQNVEEALDEKAFAKLPTEKLDELRGVLTETFPVDLWRS